MKGGVIISRPHNEKLRKIKVKKILDAARQVFCRKGFLAVTMQDIIDECGISRGGIYLYFASVDEIFLEVMKRRNKERFSVISKAVADYEPFEQVLLFYFMRQKRRLLNFKNSIFRAYCEYIFSKPKVAVEAFRDMQLGHLRRTVVSILKLGVNQNVLRDENLEQLADHFIVTIDGLSVLALAEALTEELIDNQLAILNEMVNKLTIA
jgi:AcrR family transcriptional regulator